MTFRPVFILWNCEECLNNLTSFGDFEDRSDELFQEAVYVQETWPKMLNEVNDQTFYVRAIVILVSHDHDRAIAQSFDVIVLCSNPETHDLGQISDFLIVCYLLHICLTDIQELSAQRETAIVVSPDDFDSSQSQRLSRVSFC